MRFRGSTQNLAGMGMERINKDLLNVSFDILVAIHTAAPLGGADMNPVCGAIAGAGKPFWVDKGFEQQRFDEIGVEPIGRNLVNHKREDFTGKMLNLNPWKNEKSAVVDDLREVAPASLVAPHRSRGAIFRAALVKSRHATIRLESGRLRTK